MSVAKSRSRADCQHCKDACLVLFCLLFEQLRGVKALSPGREAPRRQPPVVQPSAMATCQGLRKGLTFRPVPTIVSFVDTVHPNLNLGCCFFPKQILKSGVCPVAACCCANSAACRAPLGLFWCIKPCFGFSQPVLVHFHLGLRCIAALSGTLHSQVHCQAQKECVQFDKIATQKQLSFKPFDNKSTTIQNWNFAGTLVAFTWLPPQMSSLVILAAEVPIDDLGGITLIDSEIQSCCTRHLGESKSVTATSPSLVHSLPLALVLCLRTVTMPVFPVALAVSPIINRSALSSCEWQSVKFRTLLSPKSHLWSLHSFFPDFF